MSIWSKAELREQFSPCEKRAFLSAHLSAIEKRLYRLDFTLSGETTTKNCIGTLLLRQTSGELPSVLTSLYPLTKYEANNSETNVYTPLSRRLSSPEVLHLARYWIDTCITDHKYCPNGDFRKRKSLEPSHPLEKASGTEIDSGSVTTPPKRNSPFIRWDDPPFYPTRLIELGSIDAEVVKLIVVRNAGHRDEQISPKPKGHYVTLSHCWGSTGKPFCLGEGNLKFFRDSGIPLKELPRTFADAIHLARRLSANVKYIWIDSLCIIQGEPDDRDWLYESTKMYEVYRNSYCNISATAGKNGSRGLYAERDPKHLWGEEVNLYMDDTLTRGAGHKRKRDSPGLEALIQRCSVVDPSLWYRKVDAAPANTRAWVLQERLLAPRVLHFCEDQIAWECRELDASESASAGIESLELKSGKPKERVRLKSLLAQEYGHRSSLDDDEEVARQAHENWKRITERYSLTNLTKSKDKLIALAGIAEQMSIQIGAPYIAGIWKNKYFASQLLWRVEAQYIDGKFLYPSKRPKVYRAPSFSWAAIDAPQGILCGETADADKLLIMVTEVDVRPQPTANSEFGLVEEGGFIKLECQKVPIAIERKSRRTANGLQEDVFTWTLTGDQEGEDENWHPNVYLDSPEDDFEEIRGHYSSTWLVPAYKNSSSDLVCLLLQMKKDNSHHFRRIGLSVIPYHRSGGKTFMNETPVEENGQLRKVTKRVIQIV